MLKQEIDGQRHVIEYASRSLRDCEKRYSVTELELPAIVFACQHFRHYLLGIQFTILSDHHALCWIFRLKSPNNRLARWVIGLGDFNFRVIYRKGKENCNADFLSRYPDRREDLTNRPCMKNITKGYFKSISVNSDLMRNEQIKDMWCSNILRHITQHQDYLLGNDELLYKIKSTIFGLRKMLCVPERFRNEIMYWAHDTLEAGHSGKNKTMEKIASRYYWPRLTQDVSNYLSKIQRKIERTTWGVDSNQVEIFQRSLTKP